MYELVEFRMRHWILSTQGHSSDEAWPRVERISQLVPLRLEDVLMKKKIQDNFWGVPGQLASHSGTLQSTLDLHRVWLQDGLTL